MFTNEQCMVSDLLTLPLMAQLPSDLLRRLDTSPLYPPRGAVARMRAKLEERLGHFIMIYRAVPSSSDDGKLHLCRVVAPAPLTAAEIEQLHQAEALFSGLVFVAYAKPLSLGMGAVVT